MADLSDFSHEFTDHDKRDHQVDLDQADPSEVAGVDALRRMDAVAGKGPMLEYFAEDESSSSSIVDLPDLSLYFRQFAVQDDDVIRMCRSYASYLVSQKPKKRRRKSRSPHTPPKRNKRT